MNLVTLPSGTVVNRDQITSISRSSTTVTVNLADGNSETLTGASVDDAINLVDQFAIAAVRAITTFEQSTPVTITSVDPDPLDSTGDTIMITGTGFDSLPPDDLLLIQIDNGSGVLYYDCELVSRTSTEIVVNTPAFTPGAVPINIRFSKRQILRLFVDVVGAT